MSTKPVKRSYRLSTVTYLVFNVILGSILISGLFEILNRPLPPHLVKGGHFQFLTNLSLCLTIITIGVNVIAIITNNGTVVFIDRYFNASALIAETIVTIIYWPLKLFLTHMIVNTQVLQRKDFIPLRLDLTIHLLPLLALTFDYYFIRYDTFNIALTHVFPLLVALSFGYWYILDSLVDPINNIGQEYPYPFLNVDNGTRVVIFVTVAVFGLTCYQIYEFLHNLVVKLVFKLEDEAAEEYVVKKED